jgi:hypothetical protein
MPTANDDVQETTPNLVGELNKKLDTTLKTVEELVSVFKEYGQGYSKEKAYAKNVDFDQDQTQQRPGLSKPTKTQKSEAKLLSTADAMSVKTTSKV